MVSIAKLNNFITVILKFRSLSTLRVILCISFDYLCCQWCHKSKHVDENHINKITYLGVNGFLEFSCKVSLQD